MYAFRRPVREAMTSILDLMKLMVKAGGQNHLFFILFPRDENKVPLMVNVTEYDRDSRNEVVSVVRKIGLENDIVGYMVASESWSVKRSAPPADDDPSPSECEDRSEILMVTAISPYERVMATTTISRDGDEPSFSSIDFHDAVAGKFMLGGVFPTMFDDIFNNDGKAPSIN